MNGLRRGVMGLGLFLVAVGRVDGGLIQPGDLAFVGFNADGEDDFAVVLLAEAAAGAVVRFSDNEWVGSGFNSGEGTIAWTLTEPLAIGTVVVFSSIGATSNPGFGASSGLVSGALQFALTGETLYAFVGDSPAAPTAFLAAISTLAADYQTAPRTLAGTGLVPGSTAVLLPSGTRGAAYAGPRDGLEAFGDYLPLIGDTGGRWTTASSNGSSVLPFDTTAFTTTTVATPEPATWSLVLVAFGCGAALRRRAARQKPERPERISG